MLIAQVHTLHSGLFHQQLVSAGIETRLRLWSIFYMLDRMTVHEHGNGLVESRWQLANAEEGDTSVTPLFSLDLSSSRTSPGRAGYPVCNERL